MQLAVGDTLGPYVVLGAVGSGGMGEVYKARDTRLNRVVALKVIGTGLEQHPDVRSRFTAEALAIAALNHPHICALYDTGHALDRDFLVLEYLEGENLAHRLRRGPLTVPELLGYAIEIAEALDYAHQHRIAHRDLKPANVLLTRSSGAKLLDFGLATLRATAGGGEALSGRVTEPFEATAEGAVLGTIHYLAPERFDGRAADVRSDVFSFGAMLYEMITRRKAFDEPNQARLMAAIMSKEPPPFDPALAVPHEFHWLVQTCLAKSPDARWQSMRDVANVLKGIARTTHTSARPVARPRWHVAGAAGLAALALGGAILTRPPEASPSAPPIQGTVTLYLPPPPGSAFALTASTVKSAQFAISPDGKAVAFVATTGGVRQLWVRVLSGDDARLLPGTSGASYPFWSPDNQFVGYFADGYLKKVSAAGRAPQMVCKANNGRGAAWSPDGRVVFAPDTSTALFVVSAQGGDPHQLTALDSKHLDHRWPQVLAGGRVLFFVRSADPDVQGIYATSLDQPTGLRKIRVTAASGTAASGHLLFVLDGELVAQPMDAGTLQLTGEAVPLGLRASPSSTMSAPVSASTTGVLATWSSVGSVSELVWFDRRGTRLGTAALPDRYVDFRLAPDEKRIALARVDPASNAADLAMLDVERSFVTTITSSPHTDATPVWSTDGERLVFRSNRNGLHDLFAKSARDSGGEHLLYSAGVGMYPTDWSPDGGSILFHMLDPATKHDIWRFDVATRSVEPLQRSRHDEVQGQLGPGGRLAYTSNESGELQVYVRMVDGKDLPKNASSNGGFDPHWRADGRELFFVAPDGMLMAAEVSADGRHVNPARGLFPTAIEPTTPPYLSDFDVTRDGRRFLIKVPTEPPGAGPITVTLNWLDRIRTTGR